MSKCDKQQISLDNSSASTPISKSFSLLLAYCTCHCQLMLNTNNNISNSSFFVSQECIYHLLRLNSQYETFENCVKIKGSIVHHLDITITIKAVVLPLCITIVTFLKHLVIGFRRRSSIINYVTAFSANQTRLLYQSFIIRERAQCPILGTIR